MALFLAAGVAHSGTCRAGMADLGYGGTFFPGTSGKDFSGGKNFRFGAGYSPLKELILKGPEWEPAAPCVRFFMNGSFLFQRAGIERNAVNYAIAANPQTPALLSATSAKAKYYSATVDPTVRFEVAKRIVGIYGFGGIGWLRRTIEFTGPSLQGDLIQPVDSGVYNSVMNSAAVDVGGGMDFRLGGIAGGLKVYVEGRVIRGIGGNSKTTLAPISTGIRW